MRDMLLMIWILVLVLCVLCTRVQAQRPPGRYVVKYRSKRGEDDARGAASIIHVDLDYLDAVAATYTQEALRGLEDNPSIEYIEEDGLNYPDEGHTYLRNRYHRHLQLQSQITPYGISMVEAAQVNNLVQCNKKVCVIDSGYDFGHEDLPTTGVTGDSIKLDFLGISSIWPWDKDIIAHGM